MRYTLLIVYSVLLLAAVAAGVRLSSTVHERKRLMEDYAELNKVNYELFNIQLWKQKSLSIMQNRIRDFGISEEGYEVLESEVRKYLEGLYAQYIRSGELIRLISANIEKDGSVNKMFIQVIKDKLKEQIDLLNLPQLIPGMAQQVGEYVRQNEPMLREYMHRELIRLVVDEEFENYVDTRERFLVKYGLNNLKDTESYLLSAVAEKDKDSKKFIRFFGLLITLSIATALLMRNRIGFREMIASLSLVSILLLVLGVTLPMIDIDARLNSFEFRLLGETIDFDEQVVYYQSKSIVEVTKTLWQGEGWDLKLVGVLVLMFSIVFPFFKLILSGAYVFVDRIRNSSIARGFIFYLGKWSMADVFVVAMFMAYIGMYGVIATQLNGIARNQSGFAIETVNYSKLSPGAFFFTIYTILSICISILINRHAIELAKED